MNIKKYSFLFCLLLILTSCAGLFFSPTAKQQFEEGLALFNQGNYEEAVPRFQEATEIEPEYTKAFIYLGRSRLNLGQWFDAIPPLRTAYSLSPAETKKETVNFLFDALIGGALEAFKKGNFKESIGYLKEALDIDPSSSDAKTDLTKSVIAYGGQLLSEGEFTEAISQFSEAIQLAPGNLDGYLGLAKSFMKKGDWLDAMSTIKKALEVAPADEDRIKFQDALGQ